MGALTAMRSEMTPPPAHELFRRRRRAERRLTQAASGPLALPLSRGEARRLPFRRCSPPTGCQAFVHTKWRVQGRLRVVQALPVFPVVARSIGHARGTIASSMRTTGGEVAEVCRAGQEGREKHQQSMPVGVVAVAAVLQRLRRPRAFPASLQITAPAGGRAAASCPEIVHDRRGAPRMLSDASRLSGPVG